MFGTCVHVRVCTCVHVFWLEVVTAAYTGDCWVQYALPMPKGGRREVKVVTTADQLPRARAAAARGKSEAGYNDPDRQFFGIHTPENTAQRFVVPGADRRNPNTAKRYSNKRRK